MIMPAITQIHLVPWAVIYGVKLCLALVCQTLHAIMQGLCLNIGVDTQAPKSYSF